MRTLRTVVSRVRKELDLAPYEPEEKPGLPITIESDKGPITVHKFLTRIYQNVEIDLVYDVPNKPGFSKYHFRVW